MTLILSGTDGLSDVDGSAATPAIRGTDANTGIFFPAADTIAFSEGGTEAMRIDSSGNVGIGTTPSAWGSSVKAVQLPWGCAIFNIGAGDVAVTQNAYFDNPNFKYASTTGVGSSAYRQIDGTHRWSYAASGTAGNNITFTEAMRIDTSGNVGIGTTATTYNYQTKNIALYDATSAGISIASGSKVLTLTSQSSGGIFLGSRSNDNLIFITNDTERARIDTSGNLLVGTTSNGNSAKFLVVGGSTGGTSLQAGFGGINGTSFQIYHADAGGQSGTATVTSIAKVASSGRSINAAGTINASGADYAEYMTKAGDFTVAKGDVVGIDNNGKLTNVFSDAVSFCVKSTAPSYVGGDTWGAELEGDELEAARQAVDRIAFAGQVPVNVLGATPGQFIIPVDSNGAIIGQAVSNPTFEQYQIAVGKVIAIESDGRARIIVKVA